MVEKVQAYKADNGSVFDNEFDAVVEDTRESLGNFWDTNQIPGDGGSSTKESWVQFMIDNADRFTRDLAPIVQAASGRVA